MTKYKWTYCLNDEQYKKLYRFICKVPGLQQFIEEHDGQDLRRIVLSYKIFLESEGKAPLGARVNMEHIITKYTEFHKMFEDSKRTDSSFYFDFNPYQIQTWNPKPKWAEKMSIQEIDYLDHFIPQVIGLPEYLFKNKNYENLYDLIEAYQKELNAIGKNDAEKNFVLEVLKERFYRLMENHEDGIHYVNHSHQLDDHKVLEEFETDAANSFYTIDLDAPCIEFINKYVKSYHPYIASEIFRRLLRANKVSMALNFAHKAFFHIFSSPIIFWHNKEAIYGSFILLNNILDALGYKGAYKLKENNPKFLNNLLETTYLLLSRTIYWTDKETNKNEVYEDTNRPINIQHKIQAYKLRAHLVESFGEFLDSNISMADIGKMGISDLLCAHKLAFKSEIIGNSDKALFKKDAERLFHTKGELRRICSPEKAENEGFYINDKLAMSIHRKYRDGKYSMTEKEISDFVGFLRVYFKEEYRIAIQNEEPISYLKKDNFSPSFKSQREEIRCYLQRNGIHYLYHFTEKSKIQSIIKYGGLLSFKRCFDEAIVLPVRKDMAESRDIDARQDLEDYVRLSFCPRLPKIKERQAEGAELVMLKIDIEVALFEDTLYTDIEATQPGMSRGGSFDDLKKVNLYATQKIESSPSDSDYWQRQAEVLIKGFVPLKYIMNIKNPEKLL